MESIKPNRRRQPDFGIGRRATIVSALTFAIALALAGLAPQVGRASTGHAAPVQPARPATALATPTPAFPLSVSPNKRYLVDRNGRPFLIVGDSPQSLIVNLSVSQASSFFADRKAAGFNSLWINLLCDVYTGGRADGTTYDGIAPFTTPDDLSTPNPAYFDRADQMIQMAASDGLAVFLDPIETGGWLSVLRENGVAAAYNYGYYLGQRYSRFSNIVWLNGNDFNTWSNPQDDALVLAVAEGIKAADPTALQTVELNYLVSMSLDDPAWNGVVGLNAAYTYYPTYAEVLQAYNDPDRMPAFMVEANYDGENGYIGPSTLRRQEYWTMLSGGAGQFYGNTYTWPFSNGWQGYVDSVGSQQVSILASFFSRLPWFNLVPDTKHKLVVSGYGSFSTYQDPNVNNYVTAARTPDGGFAMAYLPSGKPITVNMHDMRGPRVLASWFDPTNGRYKAAKDSPLVGKGKHKFTVPGKNAEGDHDWVLVLTATKERK